MTRPASLARLAWWSAWAVMIAIWAAGASQRYLNHDAAWYLQMARVWLDGGTLYRDVVDTNPPLIVFLSAPPVWLAGVLGVSPVRVFDAYVFVLVLASCAACARLIDRAFAGSAFVMRQMVKTAVLFGMLPYVMGEYGQREHLAVILSLPCVIAAAAWAAGRPLPRATALATGAAAGLGLSLKPPLLLAWLFVEGVLVVVARRQGRWRRAENVGLVATVSLYVAAILLIVPQFVPMVPHIAAGYAGLNNAASTLLRLSENQLWAVAAAGLLVIRFRPIERRVILVLFAAATGLLLGALAQMKGFPYHLYPARVLIGLVLLALALSLLDRIGNLGALLRGGLRSVAAVLVLGLLAFTVRHGIGARDAPGRDLVTPLRDVVERQGGRSLYVMQMLLYPGFPLANYAGMSWPVRHNSFWFLPGLDAAELSQESGDIALHAPGAMPALEREFFEEIVSDVCARPPDVLIVEAAAYPGTTGPRRFDLLAYYGQDPRFARLLAGYRQVADVGAYTVYRRTSG